MLAVRTSVVIKLQIMVTKRATPVPSKQAESPLEEPPFLLLLVQLVGATDLAPCFGWSINGGHILPVRNEPAAEDYVLSRTHLSTGGGRRVFTRELERVLPMIGARGSANNLAKSIFLEGIIHVFVAVQREITERKRLELRIIQVLEVAIIMRSRMVIFCGHLQKGRTMGEDGNQESWCRLIGKLTIVIYGVFIGSLRPRSCQIPTFGGGLTRVREPSAGHLLDEDGLLDKERRDKIQ